MRKSIDIDMTYALGLGLIKSALYSNNFEGEIILFPESSELSWGLGFDF